MTKRSPIFGLLDFDRILLAGLDPDTVLVCTVVLLYPERADDDARAVGLR
jgi:hypothetical protein